VEVEGTCTHVGGDLGGGRREGCTPCQWRGGYARHREGCTPCQWSGSNARNDSRAWGIGEEWCGAPWWTSVGHTGAMTWQGTGEADAAQTRQERRHRGARRFATMSPKKHCQARSTTLILHFTPAALDARRRDHSTPARTTPF
jgi:hypothetical protein